MARNENHLCKWGTIFLPSKGKLSTFFVSIFPSNVDLEFYHLLRLLHGLSMSTFSGRLCLMKFGFGQFYKAHYNMACETQEIRFYIRIGSFEHFESCTFECIDSVYLMKPVPFLSTIISPMNPSNSI